MPLTILVAARPAQRRFVDTPSRVEAWQLLHREADRAYPQLRTLWQVVFSDYRADLDTDAMRAALRSGNILDVERLIAPAWRAVSDAVRLPLQLLLRETAQRSAEAVLPATEATLGAQVSVQFGVVVPQALTAIETYTGTQIEGIGETTLKSVRAVIRSGFEQGRSMTQMMRDLEAFVGLTPRQTEALETLRQRLLDAGKTRAQAQAQVDRAARRALQLRVENIARTESLFAANAGQQALWTDAARQGTLDPARFRRYWLLTPDDRLCQTVCAPIPGMNPNGVRLDEPFQTPVGPVMHPPAHPMCVPGDALVHAWDIQGTSQRWYAGEMVRLRTRCGDVLTCTPNHPVLTDEGWIAAGSLAIGDYVGRGRVGERPVVGHMDDDNRPASVADIVQALGHARSMSSVPVPVTAEDFHGDGSGSEVAVIRTDGLLGDDGQSMLLEHLQQEAFTSMQASVALDSLCRSHTFLQRFWLAFAGHVSGSRLALASFRRHGAPFQLLRFALSSERDGAFTQAAREDIPFNAEAFGQSIDRLACEVVFDQLIDIQRYPFHGLVYNLQTASEWYICNGIITHNCRCAVNGRVMDV